MNDSRREVLRKVKALPTTHAGLWLDRYLQYQTDVPEGSNTDDVKNARVDLIEDVAKNGAPEGYQKASEARALSLLDDNGSTVREVRVYKTDGRTIIGLGQKGVIEAGITLERTWGVPILPGSSLKGVAAATAHQLVESSSWRKAPKDGTPGESFAGLFGTTENRGKVIFHDAWWLPYSQSDRPLAQDIMTVHHPNYYQKKIGDRDFQVPDGTDSPIPVSFITTNNGLPFVFCLEVVKGDEEWLERAWALLEKGLVELGVGAKTNSGYGRFVFDDVTDASIRLAFETTIKAERDRKIFQHGDVQAQFEVLMGELTVLDNQRFYDALRVFEGENPYEIFQASKFATSFPDQPSEGAMKAFRRALRRHSEFGPALLKGKQIKDVQVGGAKWKELGDKLGLPLETDEEEAGNSEGVFNDLISTARDPKEWATASQTAVEKSAPATVLKQLADIGQGHFKKKKIKGAEKEALLQKLQLASKG